MSSVGHSDGILMGVACRSRNQRWGIGVDLPTGESDMRPTDRMPVDKSNLKMPCNLQPITKNVSADFFGRLRFDRRAGATNPAGSFAV